MGEAPLPARRSQAGPSPTPRARFGDVTADLLRRARSLFAPSRAAPTHVVPLGLSCRVTYQVRVHFGIATAHPFDWWVTPIAGLTCYLADPDPHRVYSATTLAEQVVDGWVRTIVAPAFGFELFHEFPRHKEGPPVRVVSPGWQEHIAAARVRDRGLLFRARAYHRPEGPRERPRWVGGGRVRRRDGVRAVLTTAGRPW